MADLDMRELEEAMWSGDHNRCHDLAPCSCCCSEHTFSNCPARLWNGCRSGLEPGQDWRTEEREWQRFYERERGMSREQFYCLDINPQIG